MVTVIYYIFWQNVQYYNIGTYLYLPMLWISDGGKKHSKILNGMIWYDNINGNGTVYIFLYL